MKQKFFMLLSFFLIFLSFNAKIESQTKTSAPLSLQIKTKIISSSCEKRVLEIDAKITNISSQNVVIDKNSIPYEYSIIYFDSSGGGKGELSKTYSFVSEGGSTTNYFILRPRESYKSKQLLEDIELFKVEQDVKFQVGVYYEQTLKESFKGIDVWKGKLNSNSSEFRFKLCKDKKAT